MSSSNFFYLAPEPYSAANFASKRSSSDASSLIDNKSYRVVFSGVTSSGLSTEEVAENLAAAFNLPEATILQKLFCGSVRTLKRGLSYEKAQRYAKLLQELGANCCIEPEKHSISKQTNPHKLDSDLTTSKKNLQRKKNRLSFQTSSNLFYDHLTVTPK